jgi:acetamidase/formamidase
VTRSPASHHLSSTPETASWGWLPNQDSAFVLSVDPGDVVVIDTVSHEGILEDQGRDPVAFFARHGVDPADVLDDAIAMAASDLHRGVPGQGPHVVTGPIEVRGAQVGDVVSVYVHDLEMRAPYGVISNRHGKGALPGEMPLADAAVTSTFARTESVDHLDPAGERIGVIDLARRTSSGAPASFRFPLRPFLGLVGVATAGAALGSVPPGRYGGNLDVALLRKGTWLHLPVLVPGAGIHVGDPHFSQGNGEVALTAFEAPLRAALSFCITPAAALADGESALFPLGETPELWIPIGLDLDLREAMKACVRNALLLLEIRHGVDRPTALAYLSAAVDFSVSQVVDVVTGVHAAIRKADLLGL